MLRTPPVIELNVPRAGKTTLRPLPCYRNRPAQFVKDCLCTDFRDPDLRQDDETSIGRAVVIFTFSIENFDVTLRQGSLEVNSR